MCYSSLSPSCNGNSLLEIFQYDNPVPAVAPLRTLPRGGSSQPSSCFPPALTSATQRWPCTHQQQWEAVLEMQEPGAAPGCLSGLSIRLRLRS